MSKPRVQTVPTPANHCKVTHHGPAPKVPAGAPPNVTTPPDYLLSAPQNVVTKNGMKTIVRTDPRNRTTITEHVPADKYDARMRELFPERFAQAPIGNENAPAAPIGNESAPPAPAAPIDHLIAPEGKATIALEAHGHARAFGFEGDFAVTVFCDGKVVPISSAKNREILFDSTFKATSDHYVFTVENLRHEPQHFKGALVVEDTTDPRGAMLLQYGVDSNPELNGHLRAMRPLLEPETSETAKTDPPPDDTAPPAA